MSNILAVTYPNAVAVTKSDSTDDPHGPFAGLLVAATGTIKFNDSNGNTVAITGSPLAGVIIPIACSRVWSTGTGATVYGLQALPWKGK